MTCHPFNAYALANSRHVDCRREMPCKQYTCQFQQNVTAVGLISEYQRCAKQPRHACLKQMAATLAQQAQAVKRVLLNEGSAARHPFEPSTKRHPRFGNDPSAGSPTETLLRLLLPLNKPVWTSSQPAAAVLRQPRWSVRCPH